MAITSRYTWGEPIGEFKGRLIYGGDCWLKMPAVYVTGIEQTGGRYPDTEEEWDLFGPHLPDEVLVIKEHMISCPEYQALLAAGVAIQECARCPLLNVGCE